MKKLFFIILPALILLTSCDTKISDMLEIMDRGNIICVDQSATSGDGSGENWENACLTIEDAVDAAKDGDEIWVAGPYDIGGSTYTIDKEISLIGGFDGDEEQKDDRVGSSKAAITGALAENFFRIEAKCKFERLIFRNSGGRAMWLESGGVEISDCEFRDCTSAGNGGVFIIFNGTPLIIKNTIFENNRAISGGCFYKDGSESYSLIDIEGCTFTGNWSTANGGVFICLSETEIIIKNTDFTYNGKDTGGTTRTGSGGVLYLDSCELTIEDGCAFEGNDISNGYGKVIYSDDSNIIIKNNCSFVDNFYASGQGVIYSVSTNTVNNCKIEISDNCGFYNNYTLSSSGAIYTDDVDLEIYNNCIFENNGSGSSGAIRIENSNLLVYDNCIFEGNYGSGGGALFFSYLEGNSIIENCQFIDNNTYPGYGGAIAGQNTNGSNSIEIINCMFDNNYAASGNGNAIYFSNTVDYNTNILTVNTFGANDDVYVEP